MGDGRHERIKREVTAAVFEGAEQILHVSVAVDDAGRRGLQYTSQRANRWLLRSRFFEADETGGDCDGRCEFVDFAEFLAQESA